MNIQAIDASQLDMPPKAVNQSEKTNNSFQELLNKLTGGEVAKEIQQKYNVTLSIDSIYNYQQILDKYDMNCTNYVQISPATLERMETDEVLKNKVMSAIEEFCSPSSQAEMKRLSPPVKSAGLIIFPDGRTLYWLEAYSDNVENEKKNVAAKTMKEAIDNYPLFETNNDDFTEMMSYYATALITDKDYENSLI